MNLSFQYERIVQPYLPELRKYCFYLTGSAWDGEDLYQHSLMKLWRFYLRVGELKDVRPFLLKIARNLWIDEYRRRQRKPVSPFMPAEWNAVATDVSYADIRGWIEWLACRLSIRQLHVWLLADYFGFTMKEIAGCLSVTMAAVRSQLHRAREKLRVCRAIAAAELGIVVDGIRAIDRMVEPSVSDGSRRSFERRGEDAAVIERSVQSIMRDHPGLLYGYKERLPQTEVRSII